MRSWIKIIAVDDLEDSKFYIVGRVFRHALAVMEGAMDFWSRSKNGKESFTVKPGLAIQFVCNDKLREYLRKNEQGVNYKLVAIEVPADHATRWRKRK